MPNYQKIDHKIIFNEQLELDIYNYNQASIQLNNTKIPNELQ